MTDEDEVVERAAEAVRAYGRHGGGMYDGPSAEEVLDEALGPCEGLDDLERWAELARAAFRRARELADESAPDREPSVPGGTTLRGGVPEYEERSGTFHPN